MRKFLTPCRPAGRRFPGLLFCGLVLLLLLPAGSPPARAGDFSLAEFSDRLADAGLDYRGFLDLRGGRRLCQPVEERSSSLGEARLQLDLDYDMGWATAKFKSDLFADAIERTSGGTVREAWILGSPLDFADLKVGRQILTWGTGDLLFINDLFPKDWKSFFIGREDEYLKAPHDAARLSLYFDVANIDIVYMPRFQPSVYINGQRLSYWSPMFGDTVGNDHVLRDHERHRWFSEDEIAVRIFRNFSGLEAALYFFDGYWKTPEGMMADGRVYFPKLRSFGFSLRSDLFGGLANLEAGYYDSRDDKSGRNPLVRNSEWRLLAGFEHELGDDFTGSLQYYLEAIQHYDRYRKSLPPGMRSQRRDHYRHLLTLRLTKLLLQQNLTLSLFTYYSPTDSDAHLRPQASYKVTDNWQVFAGANLFFGADDYTFFGQFQDNSNLYAGVRYNF